MNRTLSALPFDVTHHIHHQLVWLAYLFICIQYFLSWHIPGIDQILRYGVAICLILSIDFAKWDNFKIFLIIFLLIALIFRRLLIVWTLFCLVYQIDYYKIPVIKLAKVALIILCVQILYQIEGVFIGFLENKAIKYVKSESFTYDLGTGNANRCAGLFFRSIILLYILLRKHNRPLFCILAISLAILSFMITGSRTPFACSLLIIIIAIIIWNNYLPKWSKYIIAILPLVFFILTFYFALNFEENQSLNEMASGRLWYILKLTQEFSLNDWLIGAPRTTDDPLDSAYLEIVHTGGIILAVFFIIIFIKTTLTQFKNIKSYLPFIIPMLIGGLTEAILLRPTEISIIFWIIMMQSIIKYKPILN